MPDTKVPEVDAGKQNDSFDVGDIDPGPVSSDNEFNSRKKLAEFDSDSMEALKSRDNSYTDILISYYTYAKEILSENPKRQAKFFWVSLIILAVSPLYFFILLWCMRDSTNVVPILASAAETIGALMVFPRIIAEYLFNTNETTNINNVVSSIQAYDISIRDGIRHTVENNNQKTDA